jgi:hypothetical protein
VLSVSDDVCRHALRDRDHVPIDNEDAIVVAFDEAFHDHGAAARLPDGTLETAPHVLLAAQVEAHSASVVAVQRLGDDGVADATGNRGRLIG